MSDFNSTVRGSEHPTIRELIADTLSVWFGSQEPGPDDRETISSEALSAMLVRVADRAFCAASDPDEASLIDRASRECARGQLMAVLDCIRSRVESDGGPHLVALAQLAEDLAERI